MYNRIFEELPSKKIKELFHKIETHRLNKYLIYYHSDGIGRKIPVMAGPRPMSVSQYRYCYSVCTHIMDSFRNVARLHQKFPEICRLFYFTPEEEEWLYDFRPSFRHSYQPVIGRLDSNATFIDEESFMNFKFFELNGVALGAIFYEAVVEEIIKEVVVSELVKSGSQYKYVEKEDVRTALWDSIASYGQRLGIKNPAVAFLEDKSDRLGTPEYQFFVEYYRKKGKKAYRVDPRELYLKDREVYYEGRKIDLIYRDLEMENLIEMEKKSGKLKALRQAFRRHRVISSLAGEFDQKCLFQLFTDERYARYFPDKKDFFRHILWTRLMCETKTKSPEGKTIDLVKYAKKNQENLVLKPNRGLGGKGIIFGREVTLKRWEKTITEAIDNPKSYVVQEFSTVHKERFPVLEGGKLNFKDFYTDSGFVVFKNSLGILSRASSKEVVNIAQGGGMCATLPFVRC